MSGDEREEGKLPGAFKAPDCEQLNELLPAFRFRELIACGGMGAVYRARQVSLGRDVAIKVLPPEISAAGSVFVEFEFNSKEVVTHGSAVQCWQTVVL